MSPILIIILNYELRSLFRSFLDIPRFDVFLPEDLLLKNTGLTVYLKYDRKDALKDTDAVENFFCSVSLRSSGLDERRRK